MGVAAFCFVKGFVVVGVICLFGVSYHVGFVALLITSVFLFSKGFWLPGSIPLLLMAWNLVGLFRLRRGDVGIDRNGILEGDVEENPRVESLGDTEAHAEERDDT